MKRIKSACLEQTIHFKPREGLKAPKTALKRKRVKYKIGEKNALPDGPILLKIKKHNFYDCGDYLQ